MNSAAEMGSMFIVPDVSVCASLQIIKRYRALGDRLDIDHRSSEVGLGAAASLFTFTHRYMVMHALTV